MLRQAVSHACHPRTACRTTRQTSGTRIGKAREIHALVPNRRIIAVSGRDTVKLLQNLTTNDVSKLQDVQSTAFLTPQGRTIAVACLFRADAADETVWIDVDEGAAETLLQSIKRFKLRSKVKIEDQSERVAVAAHWDGDEPVQPGDGTLAAGSDRRAPAMGFRSLIARQSQVEATLKENGADANAKAYTIHRTINGVAETAAETAGGMPLEANVDLMNGVDYRKGCYVGQELTARTHHTGIVRKRIVPVAMYVDGAQPPDALAHAVDERLTGVLKEAQATDGTTTFDVRSERLLANEASTDEKRPSRGRSAGKLLSFVDNVGLAMLRLEQVSRWNQDILMRVQTGQEEKHSSSPHVYVRPWIPQWWPDDAKNPQQ